MATVVAVSISGTNPTSTRTQSERYWEKTNDYKLMRDYILGACSYFNFASPWALGVGIMEGGSPGNNMMQVTPTESYRDQFVNTFWAQHNVTPVTEPSLEELCSIDALNAVFAVQFMTQLSRYGKDGWEALGRLASGYNGWGAAVGGSGITAYGWSTLFLAYGKNYTNVSSYKYQGAQYSCAGTGLPSNGIVTVYQTAPNWIGAKNIDVPTWTMTTKTLTSVGGTNSNGKQIVLFAAVSMDYVSALTIDLYFKRYIKNAICPLVTTDRALVTNIVKSANKNLCVIAVGDNSYSALTAAGLAGYDSLANLKYPGFISGRGVGAKAYTAALSLAINAHNAGY